MGAAASLDFAAGALLALTGWLLPRHLARARRARLPALLLDLLPFAVGTALLGLATARPLFTGLVILALGALFTLADYTMRQVLREPVVFSEMSELPQVFTHPHLYLPFAGPVLVVGGAAAAVMLAAGLLIVEPPLWTPRPALALGGVALAALGLWAISRQPLLGATAAMLRRLVPSGEPDADARSLGPFAMLFVHTAIARAERRTRQIALAAPPVIGERGAPDVPIILIQCESFFDARRLSPQVPQGILASLDECRGGGVSGRLGVPGWGANTMRTEFAVLTGIAESELGYDRFNPYYALARVPIQSQVWRLREAGYRTLCLHPFSRRFFRRDLVMPALGFDEFLCRQTLGGRRIPPYRSDPELAEDILRVLDREGPGSFIFAITMGNHGPWVEKGPPIDPRLRALFASEVPEGAGLLRYLDGLRQSDEMLRILIAGIERRGMPAVLAFYGDHLPSFPAAFEHFGLNEPHSDYVLWPAIGAPQYRDLEAHELGRLVVDNVLQGGADLSFPAASLSHSAAAAGATA